MISYYAIGEGRPYIWLHGLLGNCLNLSSLCRSVQGKHYLLDARNHGSSFQAPGMAYSSLAADVISFMDQQKIESASVIGHSMGGKTAIALSLLYPHRINKLCIMDAAPVDYRESLGKYYTSIISYLSFIKHTDLTGKTRKEIEALCQKEFNDQNITFLLSSNLKAVENEFVWRVGIDNLIEGISEIGGWRDIDASYEGETLAIAGGKSLHTTKSPLLKSGPLRDLYGSYFSKLSIDVVPDAGHFLHVDKPSEVKQSLSNFFNS